MMDFKDDFKVFLTERRKEKLCELAEEDKLYSAFIDELEGYFEKISEMDKALYEKMEMAFKYARKVEHDTLYKLGFDDGIAFEETAHPQQDTFDI